MTASKSYTMLAKYSGRCPHCGNGMTAGKTRIAKRDGKWGHEVCPEIETVTLNSNVALAPVTTSEDLSDLIDSISALSADSDERDTSYAPAPYRPFSPSHFQQAFYEAMAERTGNIALKATAGSGKSTTLKNSTPYLDPASKVAAIVFARRNALDLQRVMPDWITACTTHSLALKNIKRAYPSIQIDEGGKKLWGILRGIERENYLNAQIIGECGADIRRLIGLRKNTLKSDWDYIASRYGITLNGDTERAYQIAERAFNESVDDMSTVDFDDMLYHCAVGNVACDKWDTLLVDECQDYNKAQTEFSLRSLSDSGRMLMVGDTMQSIFGFRGAEVDAFEQLVSATDARIMPLSITYRLPQLHVELVQSLFPEAQMQARDNASAGEIDYLEQSDLLRKVKPSDMVICRLNAPLVAPCFELIRNGVKAMIAGRDIGKGLETLLMKCAKRSGQYHSLALIMGYMGQYVTDEVSKLLRAEKGNQATTLQDQFDTLLALGDGCNTVEELKVKIANVFRDDVEGVVFSSVHKAKGLEADNVYLLNPSLIPSHMAKQDWEMKQEKNIKFVAYTRAKHGLYFVE